MNRRFRLSNAAVVLFSLCWMSMAADEPGQKTMKENLDLPYDADVQAVEEDGVSDCGGTYTRIAQQRMKRRGRPVGLQEPIFHAPGLYLLAV